MLRLLQQRWPAAHGSMRWRALLCEQEWVSAGLARLGSPHRASAGRANLCLAAVQRMQARKLALSNLALKQALTDAEAHMPAGQDLDLRWCTRAHCLQAVQAGLKHRHSQAGT